MARPVVGNVVYLRPNLTSADNPNGSGLRVCQIHVTYGGRIAVVIRADPDNTVKLFFGDDDSASGHWWRNEWVVVLSAADEAKQDAQLVRKLRDAFKRAYPLAAASCSSSDRVQAASHMKTMVSDIRLTLDELDRIVATLA